MTHSRGLYRLLPIVVLCLLLASNFAGAQAPQNVTSPAQNPDATKAPVRVFVDKATQTIRICAAELAQPEVEVETKFGRRVSSWWGSDTVEIFYAPNKYRIANDTKKGDDGIHCLEALASTGGTLKQPSNLVKEAYCSTTEDFAQYVPAKGNMEREHKSKTFIDSKGEPIPMAWAIRFRGGEFLHQVTTHTYGDLGKNVSGGCVRMDKKTSEILYALTKKHGGLYLNISGKEPAPDKPCEVPAYMSAYRQQLKEACEMIGKRTHCYERDLEDAISDGKLDADVLKAPKPATAGIPSSMAPAPQIQR